MTLFLPTHSQVLIDRTFRVTQPFYKWMADGTKAIKQLQADVLALQEGVPVSATYSVVQGDGIAVTGAGTLDSPWVIALRPLADSGVGAGLYTITRDRYGRISGSEEADAGDVPITDAGGYFTGGNVEDALQELGAASPIGKHAIWMPAGAMAPSASGGCAPFAVIASAANQPDIQTLNFDASTAEYAQFVLRMPKSWDEGTITFVPVWSHAATTTNFGVAWALQAVAMSDDDAIAASFGTAQYSIDTGGTTDDIYAGPESSAITVGGTPAAQDTVFFRIGRIVSDAGDTLAVDARLHGITIYFTTNAGNDA